MITTDTFGLSPAVSFSLPSLSYEVVVVAVKGDSATEDVLKRYASNPHLYTTFVPGRSLFMSRAKLAFTIGVKAAHNEWIVPSSGRASVESSPSAFVIFRKNGLAMMDSIVSKTIRTQAIIDIISIVIFYLKSSEIKPLGNGRQL